ncbi:hypothetical protein AOCH_002148, partial [Aspergillus ochraceoroseus]
MPSKNLRSLWPRELQSQCAKLQVQHLSRPLASFTSSQRSICTRPLHSQLSLALSDLPSSSFLRQRTATTVTATAPFASSVNGQQSYRSASRLARAIAPRPGTAAETYVAYGLTQKLFEACSSQGDYRIPQLQEKGAQVPKTEAGEDLGVGEGWWYE